MSHKQIDALFEQALKFDEVDQYWEAVYTLHSMADPAVLAASRRLIGSDQTKERVLACDVLGHGCGPAQEQLKILETALHDPDPQVFSSAASALVALRMTERVELPLELLISRLTDEDGDVRFSIAFALGGCEKAPALKSLILLTRDQDDMVRNMATMSLGGLCESNSEEIREALFERLEDALEDTRLEALSGLAAKKDARALPLVQDALRAETIDEAVVEAAKSLKDPSLWEPLKDLESWWDEDPELLQEAIQACMPKKLN